MFSNWLLFLAGEAWNKLSASEKVPYEKLNEIEKLKYEKAMAVYAAVSILGCIKFGTVNKINGPQRKSRSVVNNNDL